MAASTITRTTWTNDSGTPASPVGDGTVLNNARLQDIYAAIDALVAATITFGGLVSAEGFGVHNYSAGGTGANVIAVRNTSAGTGNYSELRGGNDSSATVTRIITTSSTYTTVGATYQAGTTIDGSGSGGLNLNASHASGPFRLFTGGTLRLAIDGQGLMTPLNGVKIAAGFLAYANANQTGVTNGTTVAFGTEAYDEAGNFASNTFTAPVAGRYLLSTMVEVTNTSGSAGNAGIYFIVSNHSAGVSLGQSYIANNEVATLDGCIIVDMDAADTATVQYVGGMQVTVSGNANANGPRESWFCGRLLL